MSSVALIGYGRFGRAIGSLFFHAEVPFRAFDPHLEVPEAVRARTMREALAGASYVVVAVPVTKLRAVLSELRPLVTPDQIVLDVGSVKVHPTEALAETFGDHVPWVGTHPLFGPLSLALAERPLRCVVCPNPRHPEATVRVRALFENIGCEVIEQSAEQHDRIMAHTHALTFFVAKGMIDAGAGLDVPFAPPSFQAISRTIETVRSDAGHLFVAIQKENPFAEAARKALVASLANIEKELAVAEVEREPESLVIPDLGVKSPVLRETREHIDAIDRQLLELLSRRAELAQRAAKAKAELGAPVVDPAREASLLDDRRAWAKELRIDPEGTVEIFRAILRFSRRLQRTT